MRSLDGIVNFVEKLPGKVTQAIGAAISGIAGLAGEAFSERRRSVRRSAAVLCRGS
jgi:hypothetical protein